LAVRHQKVVNCKKNPMKKYVAFLLVLLAVFTGCDDKKVKIKKFPKEWYYGKSPVVVFENLKENRIKQIKFKIDDAIAGGAKPFDTVPLPGIKDIKLGNHQIIFWFIAEDGKRQIIKKKFTLYAANEPVKMQYEIINEYPHDTHAFTQGLEFDGDTLFESTGQYGKSTLRKYLLDGNNLKPLSRYHFEKKFFAEGLTVWHDSILVLTWQNGKGFVFNRQLKKTGEFPYGKSKEGWGLCHNNRYVFKSDGTEKIWIINPQNLKELDFINVYAHKNKIRRINELEFVDKYIFTNIWQKNGIAVIRPATGEVIGVVDLSGLLKHVKKHPDLDVLNGIAFHSGRGTFFVTGKNWDKIFEIRIQIPQNKQ
jgi:glutamine cyclotransferase